MSRRSQKPSPSSRATINSPRPKKGTVTWKKFRAADIAAARARKQRAAPMTRAVIEEILDVLGWPWHAELSCLLDAAIAAEEAR
jgi:hypothetical protein